MMGLAEVGMWFFIFGQTGVTQPSPMTREMLGPFESLTLCQRIAGQRGGANPTFGKDDIRSNGPGVCQKVTKVEPCPDDKPHIRLDCPIYTFDPPVR